MDFAQTITVTHLFWPELAWTAGFAIVLLSMRNIYSDYKRWLKFGSLCLDFPLDVLTDDRKPFAGNGAPPNSAHFYGYSVYAIQSLWLWAIRAPGPREVTHLRSAVVSGTYLHLETDRVGSRPEMVRWYALGYFITCWRLADSLVAGFYRTGKLLHTPHRLHGLLV